MTLSTALAVIAHQHRRQLMATLAPIVIPALPYIAAGAVVVAGVAYVVDKATD